MVQSIRQDKKCEGLVTVGTSAGNWVGTHRESPVGGSQAPKHRSYETSVFGLVSGGNRTKAQSLPFLSPHQPEPEIPSWWQLKNLVLVCQRLVNLAVFCTGREGDQCCNKPFSSLTSMIQFPFHSEVGCLNNFLYKLLGVDLLLCSTWLHSRQNHRSQRQK